MDPQTVEEVLAWKPPKPELSLISGGLMYEEGRGVIYGKYKSLKSMLAMHMALCIGGGTDWLGWDTPEGGAKVLYLQIEMPHRFMKKRLESMLGHWEMTEDRLYRQQTVIWSEPFIKLDNKLGVSLLNKWLSEIKPAMLIIDPLYKVMSGNILDPNAVREFLDNLDKIIAMHGCSILIISHTRKGVYDEWGSDDLIGSMFFSAWADTIVKVTRKETGNKFEIPLTLSFDVLRHAEEPIEEMEVTFQSKSLAFTKTESGIVIPTVV